ncbi:hypothetical protein [Roseicyclus sp.]|nr:hypothetical protein [Roseicyclus sp.]
MDIADKEGNVVEGLGRRNSAWHSCPNLDIFVGLAAFVGIRL